jgi:hypothetical protein
MTSTRSLQMTLLPLTSSAEDSPASPSASPGAAKEPMTPGGSGQLCETSFRTSDQLGYLEKILLDSSQWDSTECCLTWKRSATPAGRLLFRLVPSMRRTDETAFSLWRTPAVADATRGAHPCPDKQAGKHSLVTEAKGLWPTPQSNVVYPKNGLEPKVRCPSDPQVGLADVAMWSTPTASLHNDGESPETFRARQAKLKESHRNGNGAGTPLAIQAKESALWPTPAVSDATGGKTVPAGTTPGGMRPDGSKAQVGLRTTALWSTPRASDGEKGGPNQKFGAGGQPLPAQAHGAMPSGSPELTEKPGGLNPEFVCWLMGFPAGWLD